MDFSRRTFMKIAAIGGTSLAAESGIRKVGKLVPYVVPPGKMSPVEWHTLATTCRECPAGCGMHIRHRDGRITKAEGNPAHPVNRGGLCPRGQSALQGIYDPDRVREVRIREASGPFRTETWENAFARISGRLQKAGGRVAVMSRLETGTLAEIMTSFLSAFGSDRLLFYEPFHYDALRKAHAALFGRPTIPCYHLDKCEYIVSFSADFLEAWVSNVQFAYEFAEMHQFRNGKTGRFDYIGPRLSMTAGNSDRFIRVNPGREKDIALAMLRIMHDEDLIKNGRDVIAGLVGNADIGPALNTHFTESDLRTMTRRFAKAEPGVALPGPIGAGGPEAEQLALAAGLLNYAAGNIGISVDFSRPHALSRAATGDEFRSFLKGITENDVIIINRANPVYSSRGSGELLRKAGMLVHLGTMPDETTAVSDWVLPVNDDLESWGDYEPYRGLHGILQPTMKPLADSRETGDVLIGLAAASGKVLKKWLDGKPVRTTYEWLRARWGPLLPERAWEDAVRTGGVWSAFRTEGPAAAAELKLSGASAGESRFSGRTYNRILSLTPQQAAGNALTPEFRTEALRFTDQDGNREINPDEAYLWLWSSVLLFDGRVSNRGWLQEVIEPVSTLTWGSWIDLHPNKARIAGVAEGDIVQLVTEDNASIEAPVRITNQVAEDAAAIAFGQGHLHLGDLAAGLGANAFTLLSAASAGQGLFGRVTIRKTGRKGELVSGMGSDDQHGRELLQWKPLGQATVMKPGKVIMPLPEGYDPARDLYKPHAHKKHRWAMAIDLQRCIGCQACSVACYAENNIPVVGKKEVRKRRHIPWIRAVPYMHGSDPLRIGWLPMLCQHCDAAPCEPVCPVYASVHNEEGLNAQIYNRCIGTRYCSNNCPYKVRRFSWLNYEWKKPLDWQLNPEVTVRSRGVMEKCTFCVQRIRNAEYRARRENRKLRDGEIVPACVQTCPAKVFTFGDLLDPESAVSRIIRNDPRRYQVLQELNTKPAVIYLYRVLQEEKI